LLIPSIDLMGGRIVQLVQGEKLKLAFDNFEYWIERFSTYPTVQLIDLDAAMRQGDNAALIAQIAKRLPCQVGGGIRTAQQAQALLDAGARRVIFGSILFSSEGVATETAASISKAIAFLESQSLVRRERDERRRDRYIVDDELFYQATIASARSNDQLVETARQGVTVLGPHTPAATRLENIARFLDFISESITRAAEQAREVLHTGPR